MAGRRYLIDKDGFEYGYNVDMAKHTDLYMVMEDGKPVAFAGTPSLYKASLSGVLAGDRLPTEAELLAARRLLDRHAATATSPEEDEPAPALPSVPPPSLPKSSVAKPPGLVRQDMSDRNLPPPPGKPAK